MGAFIKHRQRPEEACTPYTNYRGPGLRGARRALSIVIEINRKKRVKRKKKKKDRKFWRQCKPRLFRE